MIQQLCIALQAQLRDQGVPLPVLAGPEPTTQAGWGRERIILEFDADGTDSIARPRTLSRNPKRRFVAFEACKVTIYAQSVAAGATVSEHRARAKGLRDQVVVALEILGNLPGWFVPTSGKLVTPTDVSGAAIPGGAAYEQKFSFARDVNAITWAGDKQPEGNITGVGSTTEVHGPGGAGAGETACGA